MLDSLVMTWAHDADTGEPVYVMELGPERNGSRSRCECRSCGQPLTAVNAGKPKGTYLQKPHFRHRSGVVKDSCLVLAARAAALRLLTQDGMIDLPSRTRSSLWEGLSGSQYEGKAAIQAQRRRLADFQYRDRTSAVLTLDGGQQVIVQLTGTSITPTQSSGEDCADRATIYIHIDDPRMAGLSPDELRSRLKLVPEPLGWHCHWDDETLDREAAASARAQAREVLDWPDGIHDQDLQSVPPELRRETLLHLTVKEILAASGHVVVPKLEISEVAGHGESHVLLVTLSKRGKAEEHRYLDHWIDERTFHWQSQNATTPTSKRGEEIIHHQAHGIDLHLFVRTEKLAAGKAAPFVYQGKVVYRSHEGAGPMSVTFDVPSAVR